MIFRKSRSKPLPAPPTDTKTEDALSENSSDALSNLLHEMEDTRLDLEVMPKTNQSGILDEKVLLKQGKIHKAKVLSSWIACQSYLSQAEVDARARQTAFRMPVNRDDHFSSTLSESSGLTSRTSTSGTLTRSHTHSSGIQSSTPGGKPLLAKLSRRGKNAHYRTDLQGFRYESYTNSVCLVDLVHDDSARLREDWAKLEASWRDSLYSAGPKPSVSSKKQSKLPRR